MHLSERKRPWILVLKSQQSEKEVKIMWNGATCPNCDGKRCTVCIKKEDVCDHDHYCHSCPHDYVTEDEQGLYYHHCRLKEISII